MTTEKSPRQGGNEERTGTGTNSDGMEGLTWYSRKELDFMIGEIVMPTLLISAASKVGPDIYW